MSALIIVDLQNDFCSGGSLEIQDADTTVKFINDIKKIYHWSLVVLTANWHPKDHVSFQENNPDSELFKDAYITETKEIQMMWPTHCVQETYGARFNDNIEIDINDIIVYKGTNKYYDSYSGFGRLEEKTKLNYYLSLFNIKKVFCCGLTYDYCVGYTALSASLLKYETFVIKDATRSVNEDSDAIMDIVLQKENVKIIKSNMISKYI